MEEQTPTQPKEPIKIENATHVIGWIDSFLAIIKKYGISKVIIASLLLAIVCIFFYFIFNPTKAFEAYDSFKESRHDDLIELRMDNAPKVQSLIDKLTMKVDATRTMVLEMHNGNFGEGGLPFTRATATYEALNIGTTPIAPQYENVSLSLMPFASYLLRQGYFCGDTELIEEIDCGLYYKMKSNGTEHFSACVIMGIDKPLGFLFVSYGHNVDNATHNCEEVRENIRHVSMELSILLEVEKQLGNANKKK